MEARADINMEAKIFLVNFPYQPFDDSGDSGDMAGVDHERLPGGYIGVRDDGHCHI